MKKGYFVHPTAIVDEPAKIGEGTKIWHFTHIMSGARIGDNCVIGQNVFMGSEVVLGNNIKVQNNVSIFDGVILEDDVFCGPSMVFTNVFNPRSFISRKKEFRKTLVGKGATIGANATIVCGNRIGQYAFIGAGSVVTRDVPDYALVYGNPGKVQGWVCQCGEVMTFPSIPRGAGLRTGPSTRLRTGRSGRATCRACGKQYRKDRSGVRAT